MDYANEELARTVVAEHLQQARTARRGRQVALYNPEDDPVPNEDSLYAIKEIHLTIDRRSVRRNGRRIAFLGNPTECDGRWTVRTTNEPYQGQPITARHRARCREL